MRRAAVLALAAGLGIIASPVMAREAANLTLAQARYYDEAPVRPPPRPHAHRGDAAPSSASRVRLMAGARSAPQRPGHRAAPALLVGPLTHLMRAL